MDDTLVTYASADRVAVITLNRPAKRNAVNSEMIAALNAAWRRFAEADDRVAVIAGNGRDFCTGGDIADIRAEFWRAMPGYGVEVDKPIIAATGGWCIGFGLMMVLLSDLCVAAEDTRFMYPETRAGRAGGLVAGLVARIPHKIAMEIMLLGKEIPAQRAYEAGLVNRVVPPGTQLAVALDLARELAGNAPLPVAMLKRFVRGTMPAGPFDEAYAAQRAVDVVERSADAAEGMAALREKRKAEFRGN